MCVRVFMCIYVRLFVCSCACTCVGVWVFPCLYFQDMSLFRPVCVGVYSCACACLFGLASAYAPRYVNVCMCACACGCARVGVSLHMHLFACACMLCVGGLVFPCLYFLDIHPYSCQCIIISQV